jgi:PAS domain S-box-containing protein
LFYIVSAVICTQYSFIRDHLEVGRRQQLAESEARFRAAVEGSLDAFYLFDTIRDPQGTIVDFRLIDSNLPIESHSSEALPEPFYQRIFPSLVKVVETGQAHSEEICFPIDQGEAWVHYQGVNVGNGVAVFSRDITERKRAEETLRQSEERYRIISESMSDYAYSISIDANGNTDTEWLTGSFSRLTGFTSEEIAARGLLDFYHPDDIARVLEVLEMMKQGKPSTGEHRIVTTSGEVLWVYISRFPEWDAQAGRVVRFYNVAQDITERKRTEQTQRERERLRIALESERELNQIKNRLLMAISHEFRTPLATIQASSELLQRYFERMSLEQRAGHTTTIQTQVEHLAGMLDDISFAVQNATSGLITLRLEQADLVEMCRILVDETQRTLSNGHKLLLESGRPSVECPVDVKLFRRIMRNLLSNAVKFSPNGGEIRVELLEEGNDAVVRVLDHGIGISVEEQHHLFQPFFQASHSGVVEGTGMGLSVVKECVTLHGGTISVESEIGNGSTFTVRLPVVPEHRESPAT